MTTVYYTSHFEKRIKKYKHLKGKIEKKIANFRENPFNRSLKTHRLSGELKNYYSFSIEKNIRIMFSFESKNKVTFVDIGTHDVYK